MNCNNITPLKVGTTLAATSVSLMFSAMALGAAQKPNSKASGAKAAAVSAAVTVLPYAKGEENFEGVLARPKLAKGATAPGLIVVHNWMGVTQATQEQAKAYAELGFVVVAADIYGKGHRPKDPKEAGAFAGKYKADRALFRERLNLALSELKKQPGVQVNNLYAAGYCFGGTGVIELARSGADLRGVVSFHGGLDSPQPDDGKNIKAKVLALHGADDPYVPQKELDAFESEMRTHKVDWQLVKFGGAVHSFTDKGAGDDNSKGAAYNAVADARSWELMKGFVAELGAWKQRNDQGGGNLNH